MIPTVRTAAASILLRLDDRRTTLAAELDNARQDIADRRDRGLLVEITTGTLRWRQELDALIARASRRQISDIENRALAVLRLGAYQLRHLDRVPAHAVVHESVETVRALGAPRAAGFVNAVLRSLTRSAKNSGLPSRPPASASDAERVRYLSVTLSHPEWLVRRWLARYGFDAAERWCQFNNAPPEVTVRPLLGGEAATLIARLGEEGVDASSSAFVSDAVQLPPGSIGKLSREVLDTLLIQDQGAQLVARFAGARPGEKVLDVCAAPGGKTVVLASDLDLREVSHGSMLVCGDRRPGRVALLAATVRRAGLRAHVLALDALGPLPFGRTFDVVVADVPCSGLGTLRRDPDLKWSRTEADIERLAIDERQMLESAAAQVRAGGRLVYATCSSEPEENVEVVRAFLEGHPEFEIQRTGEPGVPAGLTDTDGCLHTLPFRDGLDAYFAARLVRRATA